MGCAERERSAAPAAGRARRVFREPERSGLLAESTRQAEKGASDRRPQRIIKRALIFRHKQDMRSNAMSQHSTLINPGHILPSAVQR